MFGRDEIVLRAPICLAPQQINRYEIDAEGDDEGNDYEEWHKRSARFVNLLAPAPANLIMRKNQSGSNGPWHLKLHRA